MCSGQALFVVFSVFRDMHFGHLAKRLANLQDDIVSTLLAHRLDGEIGVAACPVPVTIHGLRLDAADDIVTFSHAKHNVPGRGKVVDCVGEARVQVAISRLERGVVNQPGPEVSTSTNPAAACELHQGEVS